MKPRIFVGLSCQILKCVFCKVIWLAGLDKVFSPESNVQYILGNHDIVVKVQDCICSNEVHWKIAILQAVLIWPHYKLRRRLQNDMEECFGVRSGIFSY